MDVSGSMKGNKISQACETLKLMINLHDEQDAFNIIFFSTESRVWRRNELVSATTENKETAIDFVNMYGKAGGGTNIYGAYSAGFYTFRNYLTLTPEETRKMDESTLERADRGREKLKDHWKMICFLTDGQHNDRRTTSDEVAKMVKERNNGRIHIHNVAFGQDAAYSFLQQISAENKGVTRRIFANMNATASIKDFFYEATNVLMTNVQIEYDQSEVEVTSQKTFDYITKGKEVIITGKFNKSETGASQDDYKISGKLTGRGSSVDVDEKFEIDPFHGSRIADSEHKIKEFCERIWAYLKIKKLLKELKVESDPRIKETTNAQALQLSLKYNFVTPLTSIVVMHDSDREQILKHIEELQVEERDDEPYRIHFSRPVPAQYNPYPNLKRAPNPPSNPSRGRPSSPISLSFFLGGPPSVSGRPTSRFSVGCTPSVRGHNGSDGSYGGGHNHNGSYGGGHNGENLSSLTVTNNGNQHGEGPRNPPTTPPFMHSGGFEGGHRGNGCRYGSRRRRGSSTPVNIGKRSSSPDGMMLPTSVPTIPARLFMDPDVVLQLRLGVNICFDWEGKDGQVQNLIFHAKTGVVVNGLMVGVQSRIVNDKKARVCVNSMLFLVPISNTNVVITTKDIIISSSSVEQVIPLTSTCSTSPANNIKLTINQVQPDGIQLQLLIDSINYKLRIHFTDDTREGYLQLENFTITDPAIGSELDGVIGQYYDVDMFLIQSANALEWVLQIGKKSIDKMITVKQREGSYWFSENGGLPLDGDGDRFLVDSLQSKPVYSQLIAPTDTTTE